MNGKKALSIIYQVIALCILVAFTIYVLSSVTFNISPENNFAAFVIATLITLVILSISIYSFVKLWKTNTYKSDSEITENGIEVKLRAIILLSLGVVVLITYLKQVAAF